MVTSLWNEFIQYVENEQKMNKLLYSVFRQVKPVELQEDTIIISCETLGAKIFLEKRKQDIVGVLSEYMERPMELQIIVAEKKQKKKDTEAPLLQFEPTTSDVAAKAGLNRKYSFDTFAVSSSNQVAFAAAQSVAHNPGHSYNPLFLHGGVGNGKTHLAQSAGRTILEHDPGKKVFFAPGDQFINELIEAIREKNTAKFRRKYRSLDLLVIDDIQFIAGKQTIQEEFFHTFNSIVTSGGQIILTSDRPPFEIKNLEDRLRSRFSGGLIVDIQPPDFELRTAILLIKAQEKNIIIEIDAAKVIAEHITDTRALEGTLLSIYAKIIGTKDTIETVDVDAFFSTTTEKMAKKITPQEVVKTVCSYYDVKQSHIKSSSRASSIALPRQVIMYILRNELKLKLEEIAYLLKRKDHTTIMHGVEKITRQMMKDPESKQDVDRILQTLRAST